MVLLGVTRHKFYEETANAGLIHEELLRLYSYILCISTPFRTYVLPQLFPFIF
ncbi:hypothetical protein QO000_000069 [Alkalihalobacillus hemicentroti]|uniref:Uncharacterized protein n=1 Tax=Guptibacillus hwajinpoensis TaxID=208199 RepID=A0ABU0JVI7_9BACL|nr:hypothetical protein [Alkalihalobacillus hemicentroti]